MKMELVSSLLAMSFYWLCLCNHVFVVSGLCLDDQKTMLLQFKSNLTFKYPDDQYYLYFPFIPVPHRSSSRLKSWNASDDCCSWMGVTCDKEGHVIGLDLSEESISGGIDNSSSLFSLQHLQKLNLAYNDFNSVIPSGFNKLENLTYLNLSEAGFVGQVPIEVSQLTRLVTLDLSSLSPFFTGEELKLENPSLQKLVQNLTGIKQLYLDGVTITAPGHEWGSALMSLQDLRELNMKHCNLSGPLDPSLARLENLSVIVLDYNNLSSPVPATFAHMKNLTILGLSGCELTGTFPQKLFTIETLSVIDISFNYNLRVIFPDVPLSGSIQILRVGHTNFTGAFPNSVGNLKHLSELDFSSCRFDGTIPNSLSNLTKLSYLDLSFNNFTGIIPSSHFEGLHNLVYINLHYNSFTGSIPSSLFTLPSLQEIQLSYNDFSQLDEFINVTSSTLEFLDINNNNLSGPFPVCIFQLNSLVSLDLSSNKFSGIVPPNMHSELKNLFLLDLSHNNVIVKVNVTTADPLPFPNIVFLILTNCNLKAFPGFLKNHSRLALLSLSDNQIQGIVPNWIWKLQNLDSLDISNNLLTDLEGPLHNLSLSYLDLHYNKLQGSIPVFAKDVVYLDFSSNKFSSFIPLDIGNYLSQTSFLSLSNNTLHGSIPDSLCNASHLQVLDLSINNISGTIPSCLMMMSDTLELLNLKNNNFSGPIPDNVPASCCLWTLNLQGNLLDGPIPKSLAHCSKLEALNLGSNQFIGGFPCFLREISTLRILVLRNNKFQGSLNCSKANKTWEMLQIVDIAFNNFSGKLPGKFFSIWNKNIMRNKDEAILNHTVHGPSDGVDSYYQDSVTIINKGQQIDFIKILTIFSFVDFSSNNFEGPIPEELMDFKTLIALNLSNNALFGEIPSSIGNMRELESLDLSQNSLSGDIPMQLASLSFLSYLNLSFNHLVGKIPTGTQLQSFPASSFEGNDGLYGPPLTEKQDGKKPRVLPRLECGRLACTIDWNFISVELGLVFGHGIVFGPLLIWKRWRVWYWHLIHKILYWIFPQIYLEYVTQRGQTHMTLRWRY